MQFSCEHLNNRKLRFPYKKHYNLTFTESGNKRRTKNGPAIMPVDKMSFLWLDNLNWSGFSFFLVLEFLLIFIK